MLLVVARVAVYGELLITTRMSLVRCTTAHPSASVTPGLALAARDVAQGHRRRFKLRSCTYLRLVPSHGACALVLLARTQDHNDGQVAGRVLFGTSG